MLSIGAMCSGQASYYLRLAREDYYLQRGGPEGRWWGRGARELQLDGVVSDPALRQLFEGFSPNGKPLIQNAGHAHHQPGWDLTFSAPKSVSVLWSQCNEDTRLALETAHRQAVSAALQYLEDEAAWSRRGQGGATLERAGLVVAQFEHATSRALDPQLHTHCLVLNVAVRPDGTTGTILSKSFYQHKMAAGALYRASLAEHLTHRVGLRLIPDGEAFAVEGVPRALCELFSQRRAAIQHHLTAMGVASPAAAALATLATRQRKDVAVPRPELFARWQEVGRAQGFSAIEVEALLGRPATQAPERTIQGALTKALARLTRSASVFPARELLRRTAEAAQTLGLSAQTLRQGVAEGLHQLHAIVRLPDVKGEARYTTERLIRLERRLLRTAAVLGHARTHGVPREQIERILARYQQPRSAVADELRHHARELLNAARRQPTAAPNRDQIREHARTTLSAEQVTAVRRLTREGGGSLRVLEGLAGTGKTTTLRVVREVLERGGYTVLGAALSGKAADGLAQATRIPTATVRMRELQLAPDLHYRLKHHARQWLQAARGRPTFTLEKLVLDRRTALIVDEASMLGSRQMAGLVRQVKRGGGLLILVGDRRQLQPIEPGQPFAALADRLGHASLEQITRQRDPRDRQVVRDVAGGRSDRALSNLACRGLVTVAPRGQDAALLLARAWAENERHAPHNALVFCGTRADAQTLNRLCQDERLARGDLPAGEFIRCGAERLYVGERVLLAANERKLGLRSGQLGTVAAVAPFLQRIAVQLDDGQRVVIPLREYAGVQLGYAVTTHKGQGVTVENAYILAGGGVQDREISYVQVSRARGVTCVFVDSHAAGPGLRALAQRMSESHQKRLVSEPPRSHDPTHSLRQGI